MVVSLIMIAHALFYSNKYTLIIVILGYMLIVVSAIIYGLNMHQGKTISNNSETNLSFIDSVKNPISLYESNVLQLINNLQLKPSRLGIQAYNELNSLLNKSITDSTSYETSYIKKEDKDYTIKTAMQSLIKENTLASENDYTEEYNSMYQ